MNFEWPAVYSFPPFFTRQVNESVWAEQLSQWQTLVLNYAEDRRLWKLNVAESLNGELFRNKSIDRSLKPSVAKDIISHLVKEGRAEWVVGTNEGVAYIYWKKQEEWADIIYQWVTATGQKNVVFTFYEISTGELTGLQDFDGIDEHILQRSLAVLVKRENAQIFKSTDPKENGVKFF